MKRILTVQDISCVGQCSITVALPIVSAFGIETCILPSAVLSTHTSGFKGYTCRDLTEDIPGIARHWASERIAFDALYTGYIANSRQIDYLLDLPKILNSGDMTKIIDPAMADRGRLYPGFDNAFVKEMRRLVAEADYALPNITEAALLCGLPYVEREQTDGYLLALCSGVCSIGAQNVVLKGVRHGDKIGIVTYDGDKLNYYMHEWIDGYIHGTGDVYASCFVGSLMRGRSMRESAKIAANLTVSAIRETIKFPLHKYGAYFERIIPEIAETIKSW